MKKIAPATDGLLFLTCSFFRPSAALQACFPFFFFFAVCCTCRVCRHSLAYAFNCFPLTASPPSVSSAHHPPCTSTSPLPHSPWLHLQLPFSVVQKSSAHTCYLLVSLHSPQKIILFADVHLNSKLIKSITHALEREKVKVCQ